MPLAVGVVAFIFELIVEFIFGCLFELIVGFLLECIFELIPEFILECLFKLNFVLTAGFIVGFIVGFIAEFVVAFIRWSNWRGTLVLVLSGWNCGC